MSGPNTISRLFKEHKTLFILVAIGLILKVEQKRSRQNRLVRIMIHHRADS